MRRTPKFIRERVESLFQKVADVSSHQVEIDHWYEDGSARVLVTVGSENRRGDHDVDIFRARLGMATRAYAGLFYVQSLDGRDGRIGSAVIVSGTPSAVLAIITR